LIGVGSVSVDPDAFAVTDSGASPDDGVTVSTAAGGWSVPTVIAWLLAASALPATSQDRNLTVVVVVTANAAV